MCHTSPITRFWEALPHSAASHVAREAVPTTLQVLPVQHGKAGICCFSSRTGPHFSTLLISGGPARLSDRWSLVWPLFFYLSQARALFLTGPAFPAPIWDQSATGIIMGWGAQITPLHSISLGSAHASPGRCVGVKWDGWCLKTEGTSVVTDSPGTPPLPALGLCSGREDSLLEARGLG